MKRFLNILISVLLVVAILAGCAQQSAQTTTSDTQATTSAPGELKITGQVYDLFDHLWDMPMDGTDTEFLKYAIRNFKFVQSIEPLITEEAYSNFYGATVRLKQNRDGAKEEFITALCALDLKGPISENVIFLWSADSMPLLDGENISEEDLDKGPLDSYGFIPLLVKCLLDDPATAKGNIIVCSGGGMMNRSNASEAYPSIKVFNDLGYNVFVLQRRIRPYSDEDIFMDQQRAVRMVRYFAEQEGWGGQDMIAACGWSGGASTVMGAVNHLFGDRNPTYYDSDYIPDEIDSVNSDMDVALPIYGGSLDDNNENANLPAFYMNVGTVDNTGAAEGTPNLYTAVIARNVPATIDIFEGAGHGYGVGQAGAIKSTPECATWPSKADIFMQQNLGHSGN